MSGTDSGAEAKPIGVVADAGHVGVEAADAGPGEASVPGSEAEPDAGPVIAPDPLRGPVRCAVTATVVYVCNDGGPSTYDYAAGVDVQGGQPVTWVTFGDAGGTGMCQETSVSGPVPVCPTGAVCFVDGNAFGPGVQGTCL